MVRQHFQRGGNLNTNYIDFAVAGGRRLLTITPEGIGGIGTDVLWAVAYVPTYSFQVPERILSNFDTVKAGQIFQGATAASINELGNTRIPDFSERPTGSFFWFRFITAVGTPPTGWVQSPGEVESLTNNVTTGGRVNLHTYSAWKILKTGTYRVRILSSQLLGRIGLYRYVNNTQSFLVAAGGNAEREVSTNALMDHTISLNENDVIAIGSLGNWSGDSIAIHIEGAASLPGYTAP